MSRPPLSPDREVARQLLEEELARSEIEIDGASLREIFEYLAEAPEPHHGRDRALASMMGLEAGPSATRHAAYIVRRRLPRVLRRHPRLLRLLAEAAGCAIPDLAEKEEPMKGFTEVSETRRMELLEQFQLEFGELVAKTPLEEIVLLVSGSPQSVVLLNLVRRFFRGRIPVGVIFTCLPKRDGKEIVPGLGAYLESLRIYYGLDPFDPFTPEALKAYAEGNTLGCLKEAVRIIGVKGGWKVLVCAVLESDPVFDLPAEAFQQKEKGSKPSMVLMSFLEGWTPDDVVTHAQVQDLILFLPAVLSMVKGGSEEEGVDGDSSKGAEKDPVPAGGQSGTFPTLPSDLSDILQGWTKTKQRHMYLKEGAHVKYADVPMAVRQHFGESQE